MPTQMIRLLTICALASQITLCVAADGARLFSTADFVDKAKESRALNASEAAHLAKFRGLKNKVNTTVVSINRSALESNVITVVSPDGKQYQYIGAKKFDEGMKNYSWVGRSERGYLIISFTEKTMSGQFYEDGKLYVISTVEGGRYNIISQDATPPNTVDDASTPERTGSGAMTGK